MHESPHAMLRGGTHTLRPSRMMISSVHPTPIAFATAHFLASTAAFASRCFVSRISRLIFFAVTALILPRGTLVVASAAQDMSSGRRPRYAGMELAMAPPAARRRRLDLCLTYCLTFAQIRWQILCPPPDLRTAKYFLSNPRLFQFRRSNFGCSNSVVCVKRGRGEEVERHPLCHCASTTTHGGRAPTPRSRQHLTQCATSFTRAAATVLPLTRAETEKLFETHSRGEQVTSRSATWFASEA
jgi:hypothetical protein